MVLKWQFLFFLKKKKKLTLNIRHALLQNLLNNLGVLQFLLDLANDTLGQFALLADLDLSLVLYPRVEDLLGLSCNSSALLHLKGLSLQSGGFL